MKLAGQSLSQSSTYPFALPRYAGTPIAFQLSPLPLGFHQRLRQHGITPPSPPSRIARDSANRPLRDGTGNALTMFDERDADYLDACELYHQRVAVISIVEALRDDDAISFETLPPKSSNSSDWTEYADALFVEMQQSGLAAGDMILLCNEIGRISNLIDDQLRNATGNFSPPESIPAT